MPQGVGGGRESGSAFAIKTHKTLADVSIRVAGKWLFGTLWKLVGCSDNSRNEREGGIAL